MHTITLPTIRGDVELLLEVIVGFRDRGVTMKNPDGTTVQLPGTEVLVMGGGQQDLVVPEPRAAVVAFVQRAAGQAAAPRQGLWVPNAGRGQG